MRLPFTLLPVLLGCGALVLHAVSAEQKPAGKMHTILINGVQFQPARLEVVVGDTVVWRNEDIVPHTATAANSFDSKNLDKGQSWSYVAKQKGRIPYLCTYHPTMTGELVVK